MNKEKIKKYKIAKARMKEVKVPYSKNDSKRKKIDLTKEKGKLELNKEISSWSWLIEVQVLFIYNTAVIVDCN